MPETLGKAKAGKATLTGTQPNARRQVPSSPRPSPWHGRSRGGWLAPTSALPISLPLARQTHPRSICGGISAAEGLVWGQSRLAAGQAAFRRFSGPSSAGANSSRRLFKQRCRRAHRLAVYTPAEAISPKPLSAVIWSHVSPLPPKFSLHPTFQGLLPFAARLVASVP